jgi:hypothetical protein
MIQLQSTQKLSRATEKAKVGKLFVQTTSIFRQYCVTNRESGAKYTVNFFVCGGKRFSHCTGKAGTNNMACKHLNAATGLHVVIAAERQMSH